MVEMEGWQMDRRGLIGPFREVQEMAGRGRDA